MGLKHRGILRIAYVRLGLNDNRLKKSLAFYRDSFGMLESMRDTERAYLRCWHETFQYNLVLEQTEQNQLIEIGFQVRDQQDLDQLSQRIEAAGVQVETSAANEPLRGLSNSISFTIPGGQRLRLFAEMEQSGYVTGFESPDWVTPKELRGTAAPMFLNHVGLTSADPTATVKFLTEVLEFTVSEKIVSDDKQLVSALLFRMCRDVGGQELAIFPGEDNHLHHIAFTKEDPNDILVIGQYLRNDGIDIDTFGPTKQSYGNTFSMHFFDSFGIRLELCCGGRTIDAHPEYEAITWTESELGKALSYYDADVNPGFLDHSL
ncbi:MAG: VOC family protein [Immundisolibacteraceae bacterium]|nr:VOC family protein [Immundisolibacteraceae bacterium]